MSKILKSLIAIFIILSFQYVIYLIFIHSYILKWGATKQETVMQMPGDNYSEEINCTRAIDIKKPSAEVWPYLVDIGADRRGFYSYTFLEYLYGCEIGKQINEKNREITIGRLVPTTKADSHGNYNEGFQVVEVIQGQSFVLRDWGSFLVKKVDENSSRLIIRTHSKTPHNLVDKLWYSFFDMLHYIMEKRMMLGIKDIAESEEGNYSYASDLVWFLGIFFSGLAGLLLIFISKSYYKYILATVFYTIWQIVLLVFNPLPFFGIMLIVIVGALLWFNQLLQRRNNY